MTTALKAPSSLAGSASSQQASTESGSQTTPSRVPSIHIFQWSFQPCPPWTYGSATSNSSKWTVWSTNMQNHHEAPSEPSLWFAAAATEGFSRTLPIYKHWGHLLRWTGNTSAPGFDCYVLMQSVRGESHFWFWYTGLTSQHIALTVLAVRSSPRISGN